MINIIQGNDFKIIVNVKYVTTEQDDHTVQVVQDYDLRGSSDIHAYLTKVNNAAQCEDRYEINCEVDTVQSNVLIMYMNETYPVGSYGLEITGVSEYGENWRFKAKQGELFNVVASTSGARYESSDYIKLDAQIGVLGINTPSQMILENCQVLIDDAIDEVNDTIDTLDIKVDSNKNFLLGVINDNYSALDSKIDKNEADTNSGYASLSNLCGTLSTRVYTAQANINALTNTVNTNEADIEAKMSAEISRAQAAEDALDDRIDAVLSDHSEDIGEINSTINALQNTVDANETDIEAKVTALSNSLDSRINAVIGTAPAALDTLGEIADKLSNNDDAVSAIVSSVAAETTRAQAAEQANAASIASLTSTVNTLTNTVNANETDIESKVTALTNTVNANETDIEAKVTALTTTVNDNETDIEGKVAALTSTVNAIPQVLDENFETPTNIQEGTAPEAGDTFQEAIQTLTNTIADNEETWADAFNSINTSVSQLATVATSGDYDDLINKPTIPTVPTNVSSFTNDAGYLTQHQDISGKADTADLKRVAFTGSYNDLTNKPTNVSAFTNDAGYLTQHQSLDDYVPVSRLGDLGNIYNKTYPYNDTGVAHTVKSYVDDKTINYSISCVQEGKLQNHHLYDITVYAYRNGEIVANPTSGTSKNACLNILNSLNINVSLTPLYRTDTNAPEPSYARKNFWDFVTSYPSGKYVVLDADLLYQTYNTFLYEITIEQYGRNIFSPFVVESTHLHLPYIDYEKYIINKPTIPTVPTNVSEFTNDAGYLTSHQDISGKANSSDLATVATSGSYNDLSDKPTIPTVPTNVSSFTNDAGYLTSHQSLSNYYTKAEIDALLANLISISGTNMAIS